MHLSRSTPPRIALVTGGASGIGLAAAELLRDRGWTVTVLDRTPPPEGSELGFLECDLLDGLGPSVETWAAEDAPLDALIQCAGICHSVPLDQETLSRVDDNFRINVYPAILLTRVMRLRLRRSPAPAVVLTSSVQVSGATAASVVYIATKGAIEAVTRALAVDLADDRIRVNCVAPGTVKTPLWRDVQLSLGRTEQQMATHGESRRLGVPNTPEQVAHTIAFLAGTESTGINATVVAVDNGLGAVLAN